MQFASVRYELLDSLYTGNADDFDTELFIYTGDQDIKYIHASVGSLPDSVARVYEWLINSVHRLNSLRLKTA